MTAKLVVASALVALGSLAACGPKITMVKTNPAPHPLRPRPAETVEIFTTHLPDRPFAEVAVFSASKGKAEDHIDALRAEAGSYGCDGLVFTRMPSESTVSATSGTPGALPATSTGTAVGSSSATCVVWTEAAPMPAAQPAAAEQPPGATPAN